MAKKRSGLMLSAGRLWWMALAYRLGARPNGFGFHPGLRSLIAYERGRFWHRVFERERAAYHAHNFRAWWHTLWRR